MAVRAWLIMSLFWWSIVLFYLGGKFLLWQSWQLLVCQCMERERERGWGLGRWKSGVLVATTEEDSVCSRLWKSTSPTRLPGKSHQPPGSLWSYAVWSENEIGSATGWRSRAQTNWKLRWRSWWERYKRIPASPPGTTHTSTFERIPCHADYCLS